MTRAKLPLGSSVGEAVGDARPRLAVVARAVDVRRVVADARQVDRAYASPASSATARPTRISPRAVREAGIDTSLHVLPLSRVTLIRPLFVPTQIVPRATVDAPIDSIAPPGGRRLAAARRRRRDARRGRRGRG